MKIEKELNNIINHYDELIQEQNITDIWSNYSSKSMPEESYGTGDNEKFLKYTKLKTFKKDIESCMKNNNISEWNMRVFYADDSLSSNFDDILDLNDKVFVLDEGFMHFYIIVSWIENGELKSEGYYLTTEY